VPASAELLPANAESGTCVCAADFDRDGDLDLFVGGGSVPGSYPDAARSYLLLNKGGKLVEQSSAYSLSQNRPRKGGQAHFAPKTPHDHRRDGARPVPDGFGIGTYSPELAELGIVSSALWSDVDDDGWIDLLVAQEWGPVAIFKNEEGKLRNRTSESGLERLRGWWNGISGRDIDNDGDIDYVVTNCGLDTPYRASASSPAVLLHGDFDGSGQRHVVEAIARDSDLYPLRGKRASELAMPMLEVKFPRFSDFASASLVDIYGAEAISKAVRLEATTLESGVLLNHGKGRFEFVPLPRLAQAAPGFGVGLADFDGDGNCDIVLAQNFFGPQREIGRMSGGLGLLLLGKGDGTFQPVWPDRSGIVIPDDAKSTIVADINHDRWPDCVVGINDGAVQLYENSGSHSGRPVVVRLVGHPGNPSAFGARVRVRTKDGHSQTAEAVAGGSYLSQSSGELFFSQGADEPITAIDVRWPDGRQSTHEPRAEGESTIHFPFTATQVGK
jgi:hypothetical protein